jgi:hypothetical protein
MPLTTIATLSREFLGPSEKGKLLRVIFFAISSQVLMVETAEQSTVPLGYMSISRSVVHFPPSRSKDS